MYRCLSDCVRVVLMVLVLCVGVCVGHVRSPLEGPGRPDSPIQAYSPFGYVLLSRVPCSLSNSWWNTTCGLLIHSLRKIMTLFSVASCLI